MDTTRTIAVSILHNSQDLVSIIKKAHPGSNLPVRIIGIPYGLSYVSGSGIFKFGTGEYTGLLGLGDEAFLPFKRTVKLSRENRIPPEYPLLNAASQLGKSVTIEGLLMHTDRYMGNKGYELQVEKVTFGNLSYPPPEMIQEY